MFVGREVVSVAENFYVCRDFPLTMSIEVYVTVLKRVRVFWKCCISKEIKVYMEEKAVSFQWYHKLQE